MARKRLVKGVRSSDHADVMLSVRLDGDTHLRLRAMCLIRGTNASEFVGELIRSAVAGVRLPSLAGSDPAGRTDDASQGV